MKFGNLRRAVAAQTLLLLLVLLACHGLLLAQKQRLSGVVTDEENVPLANVKLILVCTDGDLRFFTDPHGRFDLVIEGDVLRLTVAGQSIGADELGDDWSDVRIVVKRADVLIHDTIVIRASTSIPGVDRRNDAVYENALFSRDDQLFSTLDAGINAGQHEGGGKSVEVRRYGFNLDHGGVSGGLKVLVDNVQQNHNSQGHGQGYLGQLKTLSPELVDDVDILDGPFSAEYGDFSGLGVVHIRQRERLPSPLTLRLQGGRFGFRRAFAAYSPRLDNADSFLSWESALTDGPFLNPLNYARHNLAGNYTRRLGNERAIGVRVNAGTNRFNSSGQIPLDQVAAGRLDRYGSVDDQNGGRSQSALVALYYRQNFDAGASLKLDGFFSRSLTDLFSNFTFFLVDRERGDGFQQHDSRLQEGANAQYLRPVRLFGRQSLLTLGANVHDNQVNLGLYPSSHRSPRGVSTGSNVHVSNIAGFAHQGVEISNSLQLGYGVRWDVFRFGVRDRVLPSASGTDASSRLQPKANLVWRPYARLPLKVYLNYGRGISSQDARGVVKRSGGPNLATTDFYQVGTNISLLQQISGSIDLFLIDRSNEQVYVPDDGSIEFKGPSRTYGYQGKVSAKLSPSLAINGGVTKVTNAFYRGTSPRLYVDSAPHTVGNVGLTFLAWKGASASLRYRHTGSYRLDGLDAALRASGLDVIDLSVTKRIRQDLDLNVTVDNVTNKRYYETQNYFESRLAPDAPEIGRLHVTPGYPFSFVLGLTYRLGQ